MEWKKYKRAKKSKIKIKEISVKSHSVSCPFCHTGMQGDFNRILMFECWNCNNPIDLRGKDGKRVYE